ncbi:hypothetical protein BH10PAT1_BH10PAT1_3660 [soil metagenome]
MTEFEPPKINVELDEFYHASERDIVRVTHDPESGYQFAGTEANDEEEVKDIRTE